MFSTHALVCLCLITIIGHLLAIEQDQDNDTLVSWSEKFSVDFSNDLTNSNYQIDSNQWEKTSRGLELIGSYGNITGPTYTGPKEIKLCFELLWRPVANSTIQDGFMPPRETKFNMSRSSTTNSDMFTASRWYGRYRLIPGYTYAINVSRQMPTTRSFFIDSINVDGSDCKKSTWKPDWSPKPDVIKLQPAATNYGLTASTNTMSKAFIVTIVTHIVVSQFLF